MSILWELIKLDLLTAKDWFGKQTASKLVVASLYLFVLAGVGVGVFFWSSTFFKYLLTFDSFGEQTAFYVIKSAVIVLSWIGILSTLISTISFLLTSDKNTDLLITLPIPDILISLRSTLKSLFINLILFSVSVFPLILAYNLAKPDLGYFPSLAGSASVLIFVLIISHFVGSSLGYLFSVLLRKNYGLPVGLFFGVLLIVFTWFILRQVFPPELKQLSDIPVGEYPAFFYNLPLMKGLWSTSWSPIIAIPLTSLLAVTSLWLQRLLFLPCWQSAKVHSSTMKKVKTISFRSVNIITKDLLSIIRNPKDIGYLFFLLSMIVAFFGLFSRGYLVNSIPDRFRIEALAFSFAWLVFFSGTYLIRLVYPLMVNEGLSRWWFFTLPVYSYRLLLSKVSVSLIASLPLVVVAILEWLLLPFTITVPFLITLSLISIILLSLLFPLIGAIYPEYRLAYDPDRASTSFTGLISIIFVFIVGLLGGWLITQTLKHGLSPELAINGFLTFTLIATFSTAVIALEHTERYTIDL